MSDIAPEMLSRLDDESKKEIMKFLEAENSKARFQQSIHSYTDTCFNKCVQNAKSDTLSSQEQNCLANCVNRFLDTNISIIKVFETLQQQR